MFDRPIDYRRRRARRRASTASAALLSVLLIVRRRSGVTFQSAVVQVDQDDPDGE
jgi:hypothetical protein